MFRCLLFSSILLLAVSSGSLAAENEDGILRNEPWGVGTDRFFKQEEVTLGACAANSEGIILCLEFFWRFGEIELYAIMPFPAGRDGKFAELKPPDLLIDQDYTFSLNQLSDSDHWLSYDGFLQVNRGKIIGWRIQATSAKRARSNPLGVFYNLSRGKNLYVTIHVDDGTTIEADFPLEGLAPFLDTMLFQAELAAPLYQDQK